MPPPELIEAYQNAVPDGGQQVLDFAVREQTHRHALEDRSQEHVARAFTLGQVLGFVLALVIVIGGFILIKDGDSVAGYASLLIGGGTLISAAVRRRSPRG
jgi:uncharacterized membrane protein